MPGSPSNNHQMFHLAIWVHLFMSLFVAAFAIDLLEEGKTIIIQRDVEHVLIKKDLTQVFAQLNRSRKAILTAKRTLAGNSLNAFSEC